MGRTLQFNVKKQRLTKDRTCDFSHIVAGSVGYLKARFIFCSEWEHKAKAASFWAENDDMEYAMLLDENNECVIPTEVLVGKEFTVSVMGATDRYLIRTNKIKVKQEVS